MAKETFPEICIAIKDDDGWTYDGCRQIDQGVPFIIIKEKKDGHMVVATPDGTVEVCDQSYVKLDDSVKRGIYKAVKALENYKLFQSGLKKVDQSSCISAFARAVGIKEKGMKV